jgi:Pyruvate/2-oxoacid:ferredoxin oxidoreductase delta subunit
VPEGQQDHGRVPLPVSIGLCGFDQGLDLAGRQVLPGSKFGVRTSGRRNCSIYSRSSIVGCRRCLDLCPTGAIAPDGDHVAIDAAVCAGCGQCAAACPTGAAGYAMPPADGLMRRLRTLLTAYREAGGRTPVLVFTMRVTAAR